MINMCLHCHDSNGATSTFAQVPVSFGSSTSKPFGTTISGATYSGIYTANGSLGGVVNVASQFNVTNKSYHPVMGKQNTPYTLTTRMVAPWNLVSKNGTSLIYGQLITCWDCHAPQGTTVMNNSTVHGAPTSSTIDNLPLRGSIFVNNASATTATSNLCLNCHVTTGNTTNHGSGSGINSSTNGSMTYFSNRCYYCHSSADTTAAYARPVRGADVHGFNTYYDNSALPAATGYAFLRRKTLVVTQDTTGAAAASCGNGSGICGPQGMGGYTPGGIY